MFTVMPSMDVEGGVVVKRVRGVQGTGLVVGDPVAVARRLRSEGAEWVHVVDLDGAVAGHPVNTGVIVAARRAGLRVQFGGGVRSVDSAIGVLRAGAERVVIGSLWLRDLGVFRELVEAVGGRVLAAVEEDASGRIVYAGWTRKSSLDVASALRLLEDTGVYGVLYTQTWIEGTMAGIDKERALRVRRATGLPVFFAGGVSGYDDVVWLCRNGFDGVVLGMALYTGRVRLPEVLRLVREECSG